MKNKLIITFIFTLIGYIFSYANLTAEQIANKIITKYETSKSMQANINILTSNGDINGSIIMQGKCFTINTPDLKTWYDGKTQWSYSTQVEEVNITEPTDEELQTSNPYMAITAFKNKYKGSVIKSKVPSEYVVRFTPKTNDCEITEVTFSVNKTNWNITQITLTSSEGEKFTTKISNAIYGKKFPKSAFQFSKNAVPANTPIIDLR